MKTSSRGHSLAKQATERTISATSTLGLLSPGAFGRTRAIAVHHLFASLDVSDRYKLHREQSNIKVPLHIWNATVNESIIQYSIFKPRNLK